MSDNQTKHAAPDSSQDESSSTTRFTIDLPDSLHKRIKVQATIEEERSMKALIVDAVEQYLSQKE